MYGAIVIFRRIPIVPACNYFVIEDTTPKVIYASQAHSQLSQVIQELKNTMCHGVPCSQCNVYNLIPSYTFPKVVSILND